MGWLGKLRVSCGLGLLMGSGTFDAVMSDFAGVGKPVTDQSEVLGTWVLTGVSSRERADLGFSFSGRASIRLRADGVMLGEFAQFSVSYSGGWLFDACMGYDSGRFTVTSGKIRRHETVAAGVDGHCYDVKLSPGAKKIDDATMTVFVRGSTMTVMSDALIREDGVLKKIIIQRSFNKISDETWDGSGVDPAVVGRYKLSGMFTESFCKGNNPQRIRPPVVRGLVSFHGSLTMTATRSAYTANFDRFGIMESESCTGVTKGDVQAGALAGTWSPVGEGQGCGGSEPGPGEIVEFDREIMGMPGGWYIKILSMSFPNDQCDDGYSHGTLISVFERQ